MSSPAQGTDEEQVVVVGNTIKSRNFTFEIGGAPAVISSAAFAVRESETGQQIFPKTECAVSGNVVTRPAIPATTTRRWKPGRYFWDIETVVGGVEKTWIRGDFVILETAQ